MRAFEIRDSFGVENLLPAERPEPEPGPGQVVVRVQAVSLNFRDLLTVNGLYNPKYKLPLVPCSDGAGVVEAVGEGVTRVAAGDRVVTLFSQAWYGGPPSRAKVRTTLGGPLDGTLAEKMALPEGGVCRYPDYLTPAEAATLPCAGLTAWNAVVGLGGVQASETVLVQGTGGVSLFALQLAALSGARVIVTSSSEAKLEEVRQMGSWAEIHYVRTPEWGRRAKELTDGVGVDLVVEVGGGGTLEQSLWAVKIGGRISLVGNLAGAETQLNLLPIFMQQVRIQGILVGSRDDFEAFARALAQHRLRPKIDRVFPFEETREAFAYMSGGQHFGKICIEL